MLIYAVIYECVYWDLPSQIGIYLFTFNYKYIDKPYIVVVGTLILDEQTNVLCFKTFSYILSKTVLICFKIGKIETLNNRGTKIF